MTALRLAACALLALLVVAAPAAATPLLSEGDAAELAQALAEATEEQGVCYAWEVSVDDQSGGLDGTDSGSSAGPGRPLGTALDLDCAKTVTLDGRVTYTCGSCEAEDSSSVSVVSTFAGGPTTKDLERLGLDGGQLKQDDGDVALANMVGALPIITASKGAAPQLEADALTGPTGAAATDRPTGSPSMPDWLRESWLPLIVSLLAVGGGTWWFVAGLVTDRRTRARAERRARLRRSRLERRDAATAAGPPADPTPSDPPAPEDS